MAEARVIDHPTAHAPLTMLVLHTPSKTVMRGNHYQHYHKLLIEELEERLGQKLEKKDLVGAWIQPFPTFLQVIPMERRDLRPEEVKTICRALLQKEYANIEVIAFLGPSAQRLGKLSDLARKIPPELATKLKYVRQGEAWPQS